MLQPSGEVFFGRCAALGDTAVFIERFLEEVSGSNVEKDVGGAGVEGEHPWFFPGAPVEGGDVADAAEIVYGDVFSSLGEDVAVENGSQRCALAAGGDVCGAEV